MEYLLSLLRRQKTRKWRQMLSHPARNCPTFSTIQHSIARASFSIQLYRVAVCDWWPDASELVIFFCHFQWPRSRSSILSRCLLCLRSPRRLMTTGLAGRTHLSAELKALFFTDRECWKKNVAWWMKKRESQKKGKREGHEADTPVLFSFTAINENNKAKCVLKMEHIIRLT